jgi:hypothetical protein
MPGVLAVANVLALPQSGRLYCLGGDPAEGNPNSDPSALMVLDVETGEEMANLVGRIEPTTLAMYFTTSFLAWNELRISSRKIDGKTATERR